MRPATAHRHAVLACVASGALLGVLPSTSQAEIVAFGSNLSADATKEAVQAHQADTAFWPTKMGNGGGVVAADGEILSIRVKGIARRNPDARPPRSDGKPNPGGETLFHFQVLEPRPDGTVRVREQNSTGAGTSSPQNMPTSGDPQQITTFVTKTRMCAFKGDFVAFNTVGGFDGVGDQRNGYDGTPLSPYPMGTPLQIFAKVPGSITANYEKADGTNNGDTLRPSPLDGLELLMETTMGTGPDANQVCAGGSKGAPAPKPSPGPGGGGGTGESAPAPKAPQFARVVSSKISLNKKGQSAVTLYCGDGDASGCSGTLQMVTRKGSQSVVIAKKGFSIARKGNGQLKLKLSKAGKKLFKKAGRKGLKVKLVAVTEPGGADHTSSKGFRLKRFGK